MTHDNPSTSATVKSMAKLQRYQNKGGKGMKQNVVMNGAPSSVRSSQRCSTKMNQQSNQVSVNGVKSRKASPNVGISKDDEGSLSGMMPESGRGTTQRKSGCNQHIIEQSGAQANQSGNRKYRYSMNNGFSPDLQQFSIPASEFSNSVPYCPTASYSTTIHVHPGSRRHSPPQPISSTFFAGSKFDVAPSPAILPPPPEHWISCDAPYEPVLSKEERCVGLTSGLKILLRVQ